MTSTIGSGYRRAPGVLVALALGAVVVAAPARAQVTPEITTTSTTTPPYPCCFTVDATPTEGLHDGDLVHITVGVPGGPPIGAVSTALCRSNPGNDPHADEGYGHECVGGGYVSQTRVSASEVHVEHRVVAVDATFPGPAYPVPIRCDDSHPCVIGVAVTAGDGERYRYSNHWYTGIIVTLAPGTLAPTTTTTTWPTTTTTAPAPAVRCPPARVPMWLWRALVALFGFRCGPPATTTTTLRPGQDMVSGRTPAST